MAPAERKEIVLVPAPPPHRAKQHLPILFGISRATAGATGLSLHLTFVPAGRALERPHARGL